MCLSGSPQGSVRREGTVEAELVCHRDHALQSLGQFELRRGSNGSPGVPDVPAGVGFSGPPHARRHGHRSAAAQQRGGGAAYILSSGKEP